jgi:hypothetical protein
MSYILADNREQANGRLRLTPGSGLQHFSAVEFFRLHVSHPDPPDWNDEVR